MSVNVFNRQVLIDLDAALDAGIASKAPLPVAFCGDKSGFIADADLHEVLGIRDAGGTEPRQSPRLKRNCSTSSPRSISRFWAADWSSPWPAIIGWSSTRRTRSWG